MKVQTLKKDLFIIDTLKEIPLNFARCGVAGWCMEVIFTSVESILVGDWRLMGRTSLIMFPIYGMGVLLGPIGAAVDEWLDGSSGKISWSDRMIRHGILFMVLIFMVEYIAGTWLNAQGICPWNYSHTGTNINGVIRLDFAPLWFGAGLIFEEITKKRRM